MPVTVSDIIRLMDSIAPPHLAEKWDNSGLQIGDPNWPVQSIMVALDPLPEVVADACQKGIDFLITHHPLIFKPLSRIDFATPAGSIVRHSVQSKMALFAAHTNLDSVKGGINDILSEKIGLTDVRVLSEAAPAARCKLVFYVPADFEQKLLDALFQTRAGVIGSYSCCSFRTSGTGTFRPGAAATPFIGRVGSLSEVDEIRIETVVAKRDVDEVVACLKKSHPYETMAYDIYPLHPEKGEAGLGRIGTLPETMGLGEFSRQVAGRLHLSRVRTAGNPRLVVKRAAICSGSGSSLLGDFFSSGAQVFISGDLRYHDARAIEEAGLGMIDIGHFGSEHLVKDELVKKLREVISATGMDVSVEACTCEKDPFVVYSS